MWRKRRFHCAKGRVQAGSVEKEANCGIFKALRKRLGGCSRFVLIDSEIRNVR